MNYENEIWKPVPGYEGHYEVSDMGRVRSIKFGKIKMRKQRISKFGYCRIWLTINDNQKPFHVHRLVYEAHKEVLEKNIQIDHINNIKADNRLDNLRPATAHQNMIHRSETMRDSGKFTSMYLGVCKVQQNNHTYFNVSYLGKRIAMFKCEHIAGFVAKMVYDCIISPEPLKKRTYKKRII